MICENCKREYPSILLARISIKGQEPKLICGECELELMYGTVETERYGFLIVRRGSHVHMSKVKIEVQDEMFNDWINIIIDGKHTCTVPVIEPKNMIRALRIIFDTMGIENVEVVEKEMKRKDEPIETCIHSGKEWMGKGKCPFCEAGNVQARS